MKRIISLCCVALILVFSLAAPAKADELENYVNLLDYITFNSNGTNLLTFSGSTSISVEMPYRMCCTYIDITVLCYGGRPSAASAGRNSSAMASLNVMKVNDRVYRIYGNLDGGYYDTLHLSLTDNDYGSQSSWYVIGANVSNVASQTAQDSVRCEVYMSASHVVGTWTAGSDPLLLQVDDSSNASFDASFWILNWERYDYFDLILQVDTYVINSISAYAGSISVPIDISYVDAGTSYGAHYYITCRIDLRGLDKSGDDPYLLVTGIGVSGVNDFYICSGTGIVIEQGVSPDVYWYQKLFTAISTGFSNLKTWISNQTSAIVAAITGDTSSGDNFQDDVQEELDELDEAQAVMDSVTKPAVDDINVSVDQYVSETDIQVLATPMAVFFEGAIFSKIIMMSIMLATVSYVLYGKR